MIPIFIPFVNRMDLLEKATRSAVCPGVEINILNNSGGASIGIPGLDFIQRRPPVPLTFSQTQNWMLDMASGDADYDSFYLFMHSDAEAVEGTIQKLSETAYALIKEGRKWGALFTSYDALAAFNVEAFENIGGWDTNLPQYFSDNDTYRRLRLSGWECVETGLPVNHEPSQTIKSDPELNFVNGITFPLYANYYARKWGGSPGHETFLTPFNRGGI